MIVKPKLLSNYVFNNVNSNGENVVAINCNLIFFLFLKIVKIEF